MANKVVLMSIMTKHSQKIFNGTKEWEFRKLPPRIATDDTLEIVVYSSKVEKSIVGKFTVEQILSCNLEQLMETTGYENDEKAMEWFKSYYHGKKLCSAIKVTKPILYDIPITLSMIKNEVPSFRPPQNFIYINENSELAKLIEKIEGNPI